MRRRSVAAAWLASCLLAVPSAAHAAPSSSGARRAHNTQRSPAPAPPEHYVQTTKCLQAANVPPPVKNGVSWAQNQLNYTSVWKLGRRGSGQTIAVLDTGVNPLPAFGNRLHAGADFVVTGGDGLDDCDGHGTIVAGIIAATPDATTGFAGVAPAAQLISIRQSSLDYGLRNPKQNVGDNVAGTTGSLADAIRFAVARGARIINISEDSCRPGSAPADAGTLAVQAAVRAAVRRGAVIVAAAGNVDTSSDCKTQNTPGVAPDTVPVPASLPGVLTVAAVDEAGRPAAFSLSGPWVDVAAPGVDLTATDPLDGSSGQINRLLTRSGRSPIQGTSFAAPYVTGVVALVRARFPDLDPRQVIDRITRTAEHPSSAGGRNDLVGYGMVNPRAALTAVLPGESPPSPAQRYGPQTLPAAQPRPDTEHDSRVVSLLGTLGLVAAILIGLIVTTTRRRRGEHVAASAGRPGAGGVGGRR